MSASTVWAEQFWNENQMKFDMKNLLALLCLLPSAVFAQNAVVEAPEEPEDVTVGATVSAVEWTDTIAVISDANRAVITKQGERVVLTVNGSGSDRNYYYRYGLEPRVDSVGVKKEKIGIDVPFAGNIRVGSATAMRFFKNIYAGVNMPVGPGKDLKAGWEIAIGEVIGFGYTPNKGATTLSAGFGFCCRTLTASNDLVFGKSGNTLMLTGIPEDSHDPSATMQFWQLQFPFLLTQKVGGDFGFSFGVLLNLNVAAKGQSRWKTGDMTVKSDIDNLHQRFFTPDVFATVGIPGVIGAYVKFSPMDAMTHYYGPRMSMLSAGINLNF